MMNSKAKRKEGTFCKSKKKKKEKGKGKEKAKEIKSFLFPLSPPRPPPLPPSLPPGLNGVMRAAIGLVRKLEIYDTC